MRDIVCSLFGTVFASFWSQSNALVSESELGNIFLYFPERLYRIGFTSSLNVW